MAEDPIPEAELAEERKGPMDERPAAEPAARKRRPGKALLLLLGVSALAVATAWFDPMNWRGEGDLSALKKEVVGLNDALGAAKAAQSDLEARLGALESKPTPVAVTPEAISGLDQRLASAEAALQAIASAPANADGSIPAASFAALQATVEGLKSDLATMGTASGGIPADAVQVIVDKALADWISKEATKAQAEIEAERAKSARSASVEMIRAALLSGAPFAESLPALAGTDIPGVLKDHAETGLPSLTALTADFPEAARQALEASLRAAPADTTLTGRFLGFLRVQTGARSLEPREGTDPDAVLSRAEAAVKAGDIAAAVQELAGLPPEGLAEMAAWSGKADLYLSAEKAIAALVAAVGP